MKHSLCLLLVIFISGCALFFNHAVCEDVLDWKRRIDQPITEHKLLAHICETYQIDQTEISVETTDDDTLVGMRWKQYPGEYTLSVDSGMLRQVSILHPIWSFDECEACLGRPERYRATYKFSGGGKTTLTLDTWQPQEGVEAYGYDFFRPPPERSDLEISGEFPVRHIVLRSPADLEVILNDTYGHGGYDYSHLREAFRPWPTTTEDIGIVVDPDVLRYWSTHGEGNASE